jgi:hypothetical protein
MGPHAETVCQFGMMHHQHLQAEARRGRLVAQADATKPRVPDSDSVRLVVSAALVALATRILDLPHNASRPVAATTGAARTSLT